MSEREVLILWSAVVALVAIAGFAVDVLVRGWP